MTIHEILAEFREDARNNRDLGDRFERLVVGFLKTDPQYASLFGDQVWLWMDWSGRRNRPDIGIDIVAEDQSTHEVWAIQCKFYLPEHTLQKGDIDSFFTASGKKPFAKRMIVSTTDKWGKHAEDALKNQTIPTIRMGIDELLNSPIEWSSFSYRTPEDLARRERHHLRPHQQEALQDAVAGFENGSRGKLIMACGTGKTFTSLRIAERVTGSGGLVLFLVPSISLLSQTLREWTSESETELRCYAICSDAKASKETTDDDISVVDLALPAHTDPRKLVEDYRASKNHQSALHIVFSTYQSIEVISRAQGYGLPRFDLIVCDEAHRTTGIEQSGKEASAFVRVHDDSYIKSKRRLYMTATPRIYDDSSKGKAKEKDVILYSMDDERHYGPEFHRLDFSKAVRLDLLTDYKVLVLAVDEGHVSRAFQAQLADANNELDLNDATRIAGCYNGLRKRFGDSDDSRSNSNDAQPMRRAVAFCRDIKSSKLISTMFGSLVNDYVNDGDLTCEAEHVDGTYNSLRRNRLLQWLRDDSDDGNTCRILSNARCLSEGVDVPALDAVMFMHPRKSVVDVVQSVGRVMRKAPGKDYGYIILPIGIPSGIKPEDALADNERYRIVWQVLQALRAHDDRFNATINKIELNKKRPGQIRIIGVGGDSDDDSDSGDRDDGQHTLEFPDIEEWRDAIYARMVLKCGTRVYWEQWANDVARIAERHIARITNLLQKSDSKYRREFDNFLQGLRENINPAVSEDEATEMLAQHLITKPVFDALFDHYEFSTSNPVSVTMQRVVDALDGETIEKESQSLQGFYASVRERAAGIDNAEGRQRVIVELYEKFFRQAFPRMSQRLGIVYTPVEIVDFILRSTEWALRKEFGIGLGDQGVHVLDPFVGTGTFPVRLLQSGLVSTDDARRKFLYELHANEIVLLAYYIAAINIEEAFHGLLGGEYHTFPGILLTDTFQLSESTTKQAEAFVENSERVAKQMQTPIRVIVGNPPYSARQASANDANENLSYPVLDQSIRDTYAANADASNISPLYDSYVRAIRWATDRIGSSGVVCFVTNGSYIDNAAMKGLRLSLLSEFTRVYVLNLRGNQRQRMRGEQSRREGGQVFGSGSRAPIALLLLVRCDNQSPDHEISYYDIGDYKSRDEKLAILRDFGSAGNVPWRRVKPNEHGDWINQRDPAFDSFVPLGKKESRRDPLSRSIFIDYSLGVNTNRDAWAYSFAADELKRNMTRMISFYNDEVFAAEETPDYKPSKDKTKISWSSSLMTRFSRGEHIDPKDDAVRTTLYRPFCKQWIYFHLPILHRPGVFPRAFPSPDSSNLSIVVSGLGSQQASALMTDQVIDLNLLDGGAQCFPLHVAPKSSGDQVSLIEGPQSRDNNISAYALKLFGERYSEHEISAEDIFYYTYAILHSPEYRDRFSTNLQKSLPRVPLSKHFVTFLDAGRELGKLHVGYESVSPYDLEETVDELEFDPYKLYRVEKMRFARSNKSVDKSTILYNSQVVLRGIPSRAYDYQIGGRSAIEWVMDRYQVTTNKDTGIGNDPNAWSAHMGEPRYVIDLVKRIVTVSMETVRIVEALPPLEEIP